MFETSKKAAWTWKRLIAVAAVPALFALAMSLICLSGPNKANAMYVLSGDGPVHVDELEGDVFVTDGSAGLVSRANGAELPLTAEEVTQDDPLYMALYMRGLMGSQE